MNILQTRMLAEKPDDIPEWFNDSSFMEIVKAGMPAIYDRYRDPKNRAKGEPVLEPYCCLESLALLAGECSELAEEYAKHRNGIGDSAAILHETGDVGLTALINAATWSKVEKRGNHE